MATLQDAKEVQEQEDARQTAHAKHVEEIIKVREAQSEPVWQGVISTKQTVGAHLGKHPADENKPDEMEALKVGKTGAEIASNITKVDQKAIVTSETGEQTEEVVDVIQVSTARADAGIAIPAGQGADAGLTEPEKTALAVEEEHPPLEATPAGGEGEGGEAAPKRRKRKS